jgi:hypothetical protein
MGVHGLFVCPLFFNNKRVGKQLLNFFWLLAFIVLVSCNDDPAPNPGPPFISLIDLSVDQQPYRNTFAGVSRNPEIVITFSEPIDHESAESSITMGTVITNVPLSFQFSNGDSTVTIEPDVDLNYSGNYKVGVSTGLQSTTGKKTDSPILVTLIVEYDPADKFPRITDDALLDLVQKQTLKYFTDFAHPASGMARERNTSGNTVTSGGTGFGIMGIIVGMERNFITRDAGIQQMKKIVTFLETAERFHGVWPHWIDGNTGKVIPFSQKDNGGDLVETSFLVQGLLAFRQYLKPADTVGNNMINRISKIWKEVEWDWYRKDNSNVLYWHWSPNFNWDMNFALSGYFEQHITYILAAASPTHGIPKIVYTNGFAKNGSIVIDATQYGIQAPMGGSFPLFWVQYSYLGMDPHFSDDYANYWTQNVNATRINHAYCVANPRGYYGYSETNWGLTASDSPAGYNAHSPSNDLGVITPTAALSSFPYTPNESMAAMKFFYYTMGDKLWGDHGFYDAFSLHTGWTANSYLAIDQGPIIVMIENYRTGLIWDLFMSSPEMQQAKTVLNLQY